MTEGDSGVMQLQDMQCQGLLVMPKAKRKVCTDSSPKLSRKRGPSDTLNCEIINICCSKLPTLWYFVTAKPGKYCTKLKQTQGHLYDVLEKSKLQG